MSCDFETENLCGWTHDPEDDFDFYRSNGYVKNSIKVVTGPKADHTIGEPLEGHYMTIKANPDPFSKSTYLISPIYNKSYSENGCFKFHFYMFGVDAVPAILRVYMRPVNTSIDRILIDEDFDLDYENNQYILFDSKAITIEKSEWHMKQVSLKNFHENFQVH